MGRGEEERKLGRRGESKRQQKGREEKGGLGSKGGRVGGGGEKGEKWGGERKKGTGGGKAQEGGGGGWGKGGGCKLEHISKQHNKPLYQRIKLTYLDGRRAGVDAVLVHKFGPKHQLFRPNAPAQLPACDTEGLSGAAHRDGALPHPWQRGCGAVSQSVNTSTIRSA